MEIKGVKYSTLGNTATSLLKNTERILDSSVTQFIDGATPIVCNYYSIDTNMSTTGIGFKDDAGAFSGARKYKFIRDYIMYGYNEVKEMTAEDKEETNTVLNLADETSLHLPNTINPKVGDLLTLSVQNKSLFYVITSVTPTTFHNKPFIKTEWALVNDIPDGKVDWSHADMVYRKLITEEFDFVPENIGTDYTVFLRPKDYELFGKIAKQREDLNEEYIDFFYDEYRNILINTEGQNNLINNYFPLIIDFQNEFKPLYVYGVNMILHHETIVKRSDLSLWKRHSLRKFIRRKDNAFLVKDNETITFKNTLYESDVRSPSYKLQSYLNDTRLYMIHEYDNDGTGAIKVKVPDDFSKVFLRYFEGSITLEYLLDILDDIYIEPTNDYLVFTPVLLYIIDTSIKEIMRREFTDRFY